MQTDTVSRNIYFALTSLLSASIAAALRRPRILQRRFAARGVFMGLCPKPRTPAFLSEKSGAKELNFSCFTLSFRAGVYGTKTGMDLRKIYCLFRLLDRKNWGGSQPQSVGKIIFCRKVSHSLRSCDTLRLFSFFKFGIFP